MQADLTCLELLLQQSAGWRYYLNQPSSALPLYRVEELEDVLEEVLQGRSLMNSKSVPARNRFRFTYVHLLRNRYYNRRGIGVRKYVSSSRNLLHCLFTRTFENAKEDRYDVAPFTTGVVKPPPPYNLTIFKSYRETVLNRSFAEFIIKSPLSRALLKWLNVGRVVQLNCKGNNEKTATATVTAAMKILTTAASV